MCLVTCAGFVAEHWALDMCHVTIKWPITYFYMLIGKLGLSPFTHIVWIYL